MLNRLVGRRRGIQLSIKGYLYAPRDGAYELKLACVDRCPLHLDERMVLETERLDTPRDEPPTGDHGPRLHSAQLLQTPYSSRSVAGGQLRWRVLSGPWRRAGRG